MQVLISDANILIDMEVGGLLEPLFALPFQFKVADLLYYDELEEQHPHLPGLGLLITELSAASMTEAVRLTSLYSSPSRYDCFALALAKQEECPLLTGDGRLRKAAEQEAVVVMGTIWLVEQMVIHPFPIARLVFSINFSFLRLPSSGIVYGQDLMPRE